MTPNPLRHSLIALAALAALTACQAPGATPAVQRRDTAIRPVATALPAEPPAGDTATTTDRFDSVIWPAVVDYHYHPAQNGPAQLRFLTIMDNRLDQSGWGALRQAVHDLGVLHPEDPAAPGSGGVEGLQLATTRVGSATDTDATVTACYTYTALSYSIESGLDSVRTPAAAQADFALVHTDTWYLYAITNQHAVPGC